MRRLGFLFLFIIVVGVGFYLGSQSMISDGDLSFSRVEERGPANAETELKQILGVSNLKSETDLTYLFHIKEEDPLKELSFCNMEKRVSAYSLISEVEGLREEGEVVEVIMTGDCSGNQRVVLFDQQFCTLSSATIRQGYSYGGGLFRGQNVFLPINKFKFFLKEIRVEYHDGEREQIVLNNEALQMLYSCKEDA